MKQYDVIIIGAGPGGIYSAWELAMKKPELKIAVFEKGRELEKRKCPINGDTVKNCVGCPSCAITNLCVSSSLHSSLSSPLKICIKTSGCCFP